jgi:hypothetical protein
LTAPSFAERLARGVHQRRLWQEEKEINERGAAEHCFSGKRQFSRKSNPATLREAHLHNFVPRALVSPPVLQPQAARKAPRALVQLLTIIAIAHSSRLCNRNNLIPATVIASEPVHMNTEVTGLVADLVLRARL